MNSMEYCAPECCYFATDSCMDDPSCYGPPEMRILEATAANETYQEYALDFARAYGCMQPAHFTPQCCHDSSCVEDTTWCPTHACCYDADPHASCYDASVCYEPETTDSTDCCMITLDDRCEYTDNICEDSEFCCRIEGYMAMENGCDSNVQLCSDFRWHNYTATAAQPQEYGQLMRHPCCDADAATCGENIDCSLPRTGKCMDIPQCPEYYRFNIYTELCEYVFECGTGMVYDWHAEACV